MVLIFLLLFCRFASKIIVFWEALQSWITIVFCYNKQSIIKVIGQMTLLLMWHISQIIMDYLSWIICRNPSLGLATKAKGLQGCGPRGSPGVTSYTPGSVRKCEGVNPHTPKATPTLGDGVPVDSRNFIE
jgi:hypothetical protein